MTTGNVIRDNAGQHFALVFPFGLLLTAATDFRYILGDSFDTPFGGGAAVDPRIWISTLAAGGTVALNNGQVDILTNAAGANGSAILQTINKARSLGGGTANVYLARLRNDAPIANNIRRWGAFDVNDGYFYEINELTVRIVTRRNGVDTAVAQAAWNGIPQAPFNAAALGVMSAYEIHYTGPTIFFRMNGKTVHTVSGTAVPLSATESLPLRFENTNINGVTQAVAMNCDNVAVNRFGPPHAQPRFIHLTGAATTILKSTPGTLHRININSPGGTSVAVYDDIAAVPANQIALINTGGATTPGTLEYGTDLNNGLTIVTVGAGVEITVIYD